MIYTSNTEISPYDLKRLLRNKVETCKPGTRIVVLHGIHGFADGRYGHEDQNLVRSFGLAIQQINKEKAEVMTKNQISIKGVILKKESENSLQNHDEIIQVLRDANILIISYCFKNLIVTDLIKKQA